MTYSISARCPETGAFGIAVTSSSIAVPARCAWVGPLGLVLSQNVTDPSLGPTGLALLRQGLGAGAVLGNLTQGTPQPAWRQVGVIDRYGQVVWHSGAQALEAGLDAGGETDDEHAAGLHVAHMFDWPVVDLRVDWHDAPIAQLRALWERYRPQQKDYVARAMNPAAAPSF